MASALAAAVSSSMNAPTGLVGSGTLRSSSSTTVWVTIPAGGRAHDVAGLQVVQDGLGQLVADVALGHGAGLGEGHVRGLVVVGRRVGERVVDHADLGAVAVGDDDVGAVLDHVHDALGGVPHERKLLLRGVAEGVAAQGDDDGLAVALFVWHKRSPPLLGIQPETPRTAWHNGPSLALTLM